MAKFKALSVVVCALLCVLCIGAGQSADEQRQPEERQALSIGSLAFLAGVWTGEMGGHVEEAWSEPRGNNIVGYFRWLRPDGTPILFEILTITEEDDVLRLRLRHYSAMLHGKEAPDKPMMLRLAQSAANRVRFEAEQDAGDLSWIEYSVADDVLTITVTFVQEGREALVFRLKRQK